MRKSYREVNGEKVFRYSIRKYHFGAASVAVAALMFFANGAVKADTLPVSPVTANTEKVNAGVTGLTEGVPPKEHPIEKSKEVEGDKTTVAQKTVDKSPLVQAISELQAAIAKADEESLLSLANQLSQLTDENKRLLDGENISEEAIASQVSRVQSLTEQVRLLKSKTEDKASNKEDGSGSKVQDKKEFEVSENAVTLVNQTAEIKKSVKDDKVEEVFNNKTKLETLLKEIDKLDPEKYTEDSVKGLKEKVAKAKEVLTTAKNQEEVNSVYKELVNYKNSSLRRVKTNHKPLEENIPKLDTTNGKETVGKKAQNTEPNGRNIAGRNHILNGITLPEGSGLRAAPNNANFRYETDGADLSSLVAGEELGYGKKVIIKVRYDKSVISSRDINITTTPNTGPRIEYTNKYRDGIAPFDGGSNVKLVGQIPNDMIGTYDLHVHILNNKNSNSQITTLKIPITVKPKKPTVSVADLVNAEGKKPVVTATVANTSISKVEFYLNGQKQTEVNATNGQATWTPTNALRENDRITVKNIAKGGIPPRDAYGNTFTTREAMSDMSDAVVIPKAPKPATPGAPTVVSDTANARVTVTPSADADRVEVTVGNSTVVATKTGSTWTLSPTKTGVSVNPTSGVITVAHNAASAGTQVSATAKHGNSDASTAASVTLPGKAATPVKDVKSDAITEVNKALEAKVKSIELSNEFTVKEKDFLKEKVRKLAILAILKIKAVTNNYDIESEKNEGIERINSVEATAPTMLELPELIVTKWQDENGNILKPNDVKIPFEIGVENEALAHGEIPGYKFIETKSADEEGVVIHIFKKVTSKIGDNNVENNYNILQSSMLSNIDESSNKVSTTKVEKISKRLANTGTTESNSGLTGLGLAVFGGLLAVTRKYREKINNG